MLARLFFTGTTLGCAVGGFFGMAPLPGGSLNPFGILFLTLSGVIWLAWTELREGYACWETKGGQGAQVPFAVRCGPMFINGLASIRHKPSASREAGRTTRQAARSAQES